MLFDWLRARVRESVLAGVSDAVSELRAGEERRHSEAATLLLTQLASDEDELDRAGVRPSRKKA